MTTLIKERKVTLDGNVYTRRDFDNFFVDVYGYSEEDVKGMEMDEMMSIVEENHDQYDMERFS